MINTNFLIGTKLFNEISYNKNEVVFDEGGFDENLYIIVSGSVSIEKYTTIEKEDTKLLSILGENDIFGEASLGGSYIKEVKIKSLEDNTKLIYLKGKEGIENFLKNYHLEGIGLLNHIIDVTNKRLLKANREITANYEIIKSIQNIESINERNIFKLINKIKMIFGCNFIIFFEKNLVMKNYLHQRYDTRQESVIQDKIIQIENKLEIKDLKETFLDNHNYIQKLNIGELDLGYLVFGSNEEFSDEDKRLISSISISLTGVLKQREIIKEEINKNYIKNI